MNNLFKTHTFYVFSLAAFVVVFLRGIELTGEPEKLLASQVKKLDDAEGGGDAAATTTEGDEENEAGSGEEDEEDLPDMGESDQEAIDIAIVNRCKDLISVITTTTWKYLRRGLFVTNKLTIATQLCFKVMIRDGLLDADMVDFLIMAYQEINTEKPATLWWLPTIAWNKVKYISKFALFKDLPAELEENSETWRRWFDEQRPETVNCPAGSCAKLKSFHRLLILRSLRPDRLLDALTAYIGATMGEDYVTEPPFDMEGTWQETSYATPIFFVLFPGVDPTSWVEALGAKLNKTMSNGMFVNISMGEGQEATAARKLDELASKGGWIMLQNVS
jgi:dynein heavy chain